MVIRQSRLSTETAYGDWIIDSQDSQLITTPNVGGRSIVTTDSRKKWSGKYYFEVTFQSTDLTLFVGIAGEKVNYSATQSASLPEAKTLLCSTSIFYGNSSTTYSGQLVGLQTLGVLIDTDTGTIKYTNNGVMTTISNSEAYLFETFRPILRTNGSTTKTVRVNFGNTPFLYPIPSGYKPYNEEVVELMIIKDGENYYTNENKIEFIETNMTANNRPIPLVASASSQFSSTFAAWKAFDGIQATSGAWVTASNVLSGWLMIDFSVKTPINGFTITARDIGTANITSPKVFNLQGSDDGINFTTLASYDSETLWKPRESRNYYISQEANYRYYRLNVIENEGNSTYVSIGQLQFFTINTLMKIPDASPETIGKYGTKSFKHLDIPINSINEVLPDGTVTRLAISLTKGIDYLSDSFEVIYYTETTPNDSAIVGIKSDYSAINDLVGNIEVYKYNDTIPIIENTIEVKGALANLDRTAISTDNINIAGVESIDSIIISAIGDIRTSISFDSGVTYHAYRNGQWDRVNDLSEGMNPIEVLGLTGEEYNLIRGSSDTLKFAYWIGDGAALDNLRMQVSLQGTERIATGNDYNLSYDQSTKTISIQYNKNGTFSVNYLDVIV